MITGGAEGIGHIADLIERDLLPQAADEPRRSEIRVLAQLVRLAAEDYDRAVDVLMADRADIVPILRDALPLLETARDTLVDDVRERLADRPDGYRVSVLRARSDRDLAVLDAVHRVLGDRPDTGALVYRIWRFLDDFAERRRFETPL